MNTLKLPILIGNEPYYSSTFETVSSEIDEYSLELSKCTGLTFNRILKKAQGAVSEINSISNSDWFDIFKFSARDLNSDSESGDLRLSDAIEICKIFSGLPVARIKTSIEALQKDIADVDRIVDGQIYGLHPDCLTSGETGLNFALIPSGEHLLINVPGNSPTIHINWLIPLMLRRPVIVVASKEDAALPLFIAECLYNHGLPSGAVSVVFELSNNLYSKAHQVMWSGNVPRDITASCNSLKSYHHGRSKLVLDGECSVDDLSERLLRSVTMGGGRLCTNISGILTTTKDRASSISETIAKKFLQIPLLGLEDKNCALPAFSKKSDALEVDAYIESLIVKGARDITKILNNEKSYSRVIEIEGAFFIRPTVMLVPESFVDFGIELSFPFLTVMPSSRSELVNLCAHSLIVSLISNDDILIDKFYRSPLIDKFCVNEQFDVGYCATDPHEGLISDFLFQKKAYRN